MAIGDDNTMAYPDKIYDGYVDSSGEKWLKCERCGDIDMESNMYICPKCHKIICDDCYFRSAEVCCQCFNDEG